MLDVEQVNQAALQRGKILFGVHPARIVDDVINAARDYASDCVDEIEQALLEDEEVKQMPGFEKSVKLCCDQLQATMIEAQLVPFEKYERNVLRHLEVPEGLSFVPELIAESKTSAEELEDLNEQVLQLEREIAAACYIRQQLEEEEEEIDTQLLESERVRQQFEQLTTSLVARGVESLPSTIIKVMADVSELSSQTQRMQAALTSLQHQEHRKDPLARILPDCQRAQRAFGSASVDDVARASARLAIAAQ